MTEGGTAMTMTEKGWVLLAIAAILAASILLWASGLVSGMLAAIFAASLTVMFVTNTVSAFKGEPAILEGIDIDINLDGDPPSPQELAEQRRKAEEILAMADRRSRMLRLARRSSWAAVALAVVAIMLGRHVVGEDVSKAAAATIEWLLGGGIIAVMLALGAAMSVIAMLIGRYIEAPRKEAEDLLASIDELEPGDYPYESADYERLRREYPRLEAYHAHLDALGRKPIMAEWEAAKKLADEVF